jgi:hypothetical protein
MTETVLREIVKQGIHMQFFIQETLPIKGKPAQEKPGSRTVYIVKIALGERESLLESSRGGPREWASLDKLAKWLKSYGIVNYTVRHENTQTLLRQQVTVLNGTEN